jgi:hypothetical protein
LVAKMDRSALSTSLLVLFVLFSVQFFLGMAQNLLIMTPMTTFPQDSSSYSNALNYIVSGGDWALTTHFFVDIAIIAVGIVNLALVIHKSNVYRVLSIASFLGVLFAFISGLRFAAVNFSQDPISFQMATGFIIAFILYFVMAMLMYRDAAIHKS